jgi:hypothetical protein
MNYVLNELAKRFSEEHDSSRTYLLLIDAGEEGEDDARSAWPFDTLGYTHNTIAATTRRNEVTRSKSLEKRRQFGLGSATRPHEAGIASNRRSAILR